MAYTVHNFEQGDVLYAEQLNEMDAQIAENEESIENGVSFDMLAEDYSANKTYSIGDYVVYNNELYACIYEITAPEGWNSAHWETANLGDSISEVKTAIAVDPPYFKTITGFSGITTYTGYIKTDGTPQDGGSGWVRTDYIETAPGAKIVSSLKGYDVFPIIAFYDASKNYLSSISVLSDTQSIVDTSMVVPDSVKYVIFVSQTNYDNRGFTAETISDIGEAVGEIGESLGLVSNSFKKITGFENIQTYVGYVNASGGFVSASSGWVRTGFIPTAEGAEITAALKGYLTNPIVAFYSADGTYLAEKSILSNSQLVININTTVPAGVAYAVFVSQTTFDGRIFSIGTPANLLETVNVLGNDLYPFKGKKVLCLGDSLTAGRDGLGNILLHNYPYYMQQSMLKKCTIDNQGVIGSTSVTYWNNTIKNLTIDNTVDIVLMMWGTNGGLVRNTLDTDVEPYDDYEDYADTGVGDFCKIIEYVMEQTQNKAQIILLTPPYNGDTSINDRVINAQPVVKAIAERYNLSVIDMFKSGINKWNTSTYMPDDSVHFNEEGYKWIGTYIGSCINAIAAKRNL